MTEKEVKEQLKTLCSIRPSAEYARISKMSILAQPSKRAKATRVFGNVLSQSMQLSVSIGLVALFLILALSNTLSIFHPLSEPNLSGIDSEALFTEAEAVSNSIDIYIDEAAYFDNIAETTAVALNEAAVNGPDHTNPLLIEEELDRFINPDPSSGNDVDALLDELIL
jgi:hypothetical protein